MTVPRLVVCGLESGAAVALATAAFLLSLGDHRAVRPVCVGLDMPLLRLLQSAATRAPRVLDLAMHEEEAALELLEFWGEGCDLLVLAGVEPALDRWQGVKGSRPVDVAAGLDAPMLLVVDARERGATAAAAVCGVKSLARRVEIAGAIIVGGDDRGAGAELAEIVRRDAGVPILGWVPPQLSEQFARQFTFGSGAVRQIGPRPMAGGVRQLCAEAGTYLRTDEILEAASHAGFLPRRPRRVLAPAPTASGLTLAVAWGRPLEPFPMENVDLLQAMGLDLAPVDIAHDVGLPRGADGLLISGWLDEDALPDFSNNTGLRTAIAAATDAGLPTLALGAGALLLLRRLADSRGRSHELAGVFPAEGELLEWYERPHYVRATPGPGNPFDKGENTLYELFDLEFALLEREMFAYQVGASGEQSQAEGFALPRVLATTLYPSLPGCPALAGGFVAAMREAGARR